MVHFVQRLSDFGIVSYETYSVEYNNATSTRASSPERDSVANQQLLHYNNSYTSDELYRPDKTTPILSVKYIWLFW